MYPVVLRNNADIIRETEKVVEQSSNYLRLSKAIQTLLNRELDSKQKSNFKYCTKIMSVICADVKGSKENFKNHINTIEKCHKKALFLLLSHFPNVDQWDKEIKYYNSLIADFIDKSIEIDISEEVQKRLKGLLPKILMGDKLPYHGKRIDGEITWISNGNNFVFALTSNPRVLFKMPRTGSYDLHKGRILDENGINETRWDNMLRAREVCNVHNLGLLVIPRAQKFDIQMPTRKYVIIAEEAIDIDTDYHRYAKYSKELNETARQLSVFVSKTGFNDVVWRNTPLIREDYNFRGARRIALIDLEHMNNAYNGFFGDPNGSPGILASFFPEQVDIILDEACKQGILPKHQAQLKKQEIMLKRRLQNYFYGAAY